MAVAAGGELVTVGGIRVAAKIVLVGIGEAVAGSAAKGGGVLLGIGTAVTVT